MLEPSISSDSGVAEVAGKTGKSSSESTATVIRRDNFEHEVRKVFLRILKIQARKLVPG
jgi:hypothetical protein